MNLLFLPSSAYSCFCGINICEKHCFKKRQDPQQPQNFKEICVLCEEEYLVRIIYLDFLEKKTLNNSIFFFIEQKFQELMQDLKNQRSQLQEIDKMVPTSIKKLRKYSSLRSAPQSVPHRYRFCNNGSQA